MNKILIVDCDEVIRLLYAAELRDEGYEVATTSNYTDLMSVVEHYEPDLLVFDIRPGDINDLDLLYEIKEVHKNISVILCSGYIGIPSNMKSWIADSYVVKSADLSVLKLKIKLLFEGEMQQMENRLTAEYQESFCVA